MEPGGGGPDGAPPRPGARHLTLVGSFSLVDGSGRVPLTMAVQRFLALLALRGPCRRSPLAGTLWPETTEVRALANLRTATWRANQASPHLVVAAADSLSLAPDVDVDITRLLPAAHRVMTGADSDGTDWLNGDGELLPGWEDEWLVADRERLRQLRLHALEATAAQLAERGRYGLALEAALAALRTDVLRESAHRAVIRIHLAEGNTVAAVQAYRYCRDVLQREVGLAPSEETTGLLNGGAAV